MNKSDKEGFGAAIASLSFKVALGLCLACGLAFSASATTYYVSPSGDDSASGLSDAPVKSLSVVLAKAADGDTVNVAAGDYPDMTSTLYTFKNPSTNKDTKQYYLGIVTNAVTIVGAGEATTVLHGTVPAADVDTYRPGGLWVANAQAKVSGLAFTDCFCQGTKGDDDSTYMIGAAIHLVAGTVTGCRVFNLKAKASTSHGRNSPVYIAGGTFSDSIVSNNVQGVNGKAPGGVYVNGGTLAGTLVAWNSGSDQLRPHGVLLAAGVVTNCVVYGNRKYYTSMRTAAGGVYVTGGTLANSVIACNENVANDNSNGLNGMYYAGGVCVGGAATVVNCLIVGNIVQSMWPNSAGGLVVNSSNAKVSYVTVSGNATPLGLGGVHLMAGTVKGLVSWGNGGTDFSQSGGTVTDSCTTDPLFTSTAVAFHARVADYADAFALKRTSPCRNAVTDAAPPANDLTGLARDATPDMGCHEVQSVASGDLALTVLPSSAEVRSGSAFTATVSTEGDATGIDGYTWTITTNGVSRVEQTAANQPTLTVADARTAVYTIEVSAKNADGAARTDSCTVTVRPGTTYLSTTGSNQYPYDTPETAARNLGDALAAVHATDGEPGRVCVAAGDYASMTTVDAAGKHPLGFVDRPVEVVGSDDPTKTIFRFAGTDEGGGLVVQNAKALVRGLTLSGYAKTDSDTGYLFGMALRLTGGVVSNCVITGCDQPSKSGSSRSLSVFSVFGGLMTHCAVTNNAHTHQNAYARGGLTGYLRGGTLRRVRIADSSYTGTDQATSVGLLMDGGTVEDCEFVNISATGANTGTQQAFALHAKGGTVRRCLFSGISNATTGFTKTTAPVILNGAVTFENCLIVDCENATSCSGSAGALLVNHASAVVRHVTAARNSVSASASGAITLASGTVTASIAFSNTSSPDLQKNGGTVTWSCYPTADGTDTNISDSPAFENVSTQVSTLDGLSAFLISKTSPCRNTALYGETLVTDDILGNPRAEYGSSETDYPDRGCYEVQISTALEASVAVGAGGNYATDETMVFTVSLVKGEETVPVATSVWEVTDGVHVYVGTVEGGVFTVPSPSDGTYTVTVTAKDAAGTAAPEVTVPDMATAKPPVVYVSLAGTGDAPYDTPAKATSNFWEAVGAVFASDSRRGRVVVADGTYRPTEFSSYLTLAILANVDRNIELAGNDADPSRVFVDFASSARPGSCFILSHAGAFLHGFTITGKAHSTNATGMSSPASGLAVNMSDGVVSNCVVTGCDSTANAFETQVPVSMSGGLVTDSRIVSNALAHCGVSGQPYGRFATGVYMTGGTLRRSLVGWNGSVNCSDQTTAGGVRMTDGAVLDCEIVGNILTDTKGYGGVGAAAGLWASAGTIERCHIHDNTNRVSSASAFQSHQAGGVFLYHNPLMRNCLVDNNVTEGRNSTSAGGLTVYCDSQSENRLAKAINCTVADNVADETGTDQFYMTDYASEYPYSRGKGSYNLLVPGEVLISTKETNLSDSLTGTDFDPCFRLYGTRNYRLRRVSPAINAGDSIGWTAADTDLDGAPRLYGKEIDIGCYERQGSGFGIIIR